MDTYEIPNAIHTMLECMDLNQPEYYNTHSKFLLFVIWIVNARRFASCFTEDGVVSVVRSGTTKKGESELQDLCKFLHKNFGHLAHMEYGVCLRKDGDAIKNRSYWQAVCFKTGQIMSAGIHEDEFISVHGRWLCKERKIIHKFVRDSWGFLSQCVQCFCKRRKIM